MSHPVADRGRTVLRFLRRWLVIAVPTVLFVSVLTFVLSTMVPGDAARTILGMNAPPSQYEALRSELKLDDPLPERYGAWLSGAVRGDLGHSIINDDAISHQISARLWVTLSLMLGATIVATLLGVVLGLASALWRGPAGRAVDVVSLFGAAAPAYWLALVLAWVFAIQLRVLPAIGYVPLSESPVEWARSLVLPVLTLGLSGSVLIAKQTRDSVRTELAQDYVVTLRARGLRRRTIVFKHILRNAAKPVVTAIGIVVLGLLAGTVLVESVFVMPGLGSLAVSSTVTHDVPAIQGIAVTYTIIVVLITLVMEGLYVALDPKARA
jgi:peptide/nickel transport system permease protein